MSDKPPSPQFAEKFPLGVGSLILGISAVSFLSHYLVVACLLGVIGIVSSVLTLKSNVDRLDKILSVIAFILSLVSVAYILIVFVKR